MLIGDKVFSRVTGEPFLVAGIGVYGPGVLPPLGEDELLVYRAAIGENGTPSYEVIRVPMYAVENFQAQVRGNLAQQAIANAQMQEFKGKTVTPAVN